MNKHKKGFGLVLGVLAVCVVLYFSFFRSNGERIDKHIDFPFIADTSIVGEVDVFIEKPSKKVVENSAMILWKELFWTINDSGGKPRLYGMNTKTGEIEKVIKIKGADNNDWEELTQDDEFIYIGDFGNNYGTRKDLRILKLSKKYFPEGKDTLAKVKKIKFKYEDQKDFSLAKHSNSFDCEAMVAGSQKLYLFSKDWVNRITTCYSVSKKPGKHKAKIISRFNADGLITGACLHNNSLALVGYKKYTPFLWFFDNVEGQNFFDGYKARIDLPIIHGSQTEGICFWNSDTLIVSEEETGASYRVFQYDISQLKKAAQLQ